MTTHGAPITALQETIEREEFFSLSDEVILCQIRDAFEPELEHLKDAYAMQEPGESGVTSPVESRPRAISPSQILYGTDYDEINRTLVGVLALRWIINDDYATFTCNQPPVVKLRRRSFKWLRDLFVDGLKQPADIFALVTAMIINDLGKDSKLEEEYFRVTRKSVQGLNHDTILFEAAKEGMVPCLDRLDAAYKEDLMLGLELGSELNAGQLAQAENVIGSLEGLFVMRGHERAFKLKFMEQLLDVAGSGGHADPTCAKKMIEPVCEGFQTVHEVALDIISGTSTLQQGYDTVLIGREKMLRRKGFRALSVRDPEERALLRLLTMGRTADVAQAQLFYDAFYGLPETTRHKLVNGLNVNGHDDGVAILPYYMPAMLSEGLQNTEHGWIREKQAALQSLMEFLGRVLQDTKPRPGQDGVVIERNLMYAQKTIASLEFRKNPKVLERLEIPPGEILRRRRTSNSSAATASELEASRLIGRDVRNDHNEAMSPSSPT